MSERVSAFLVATLVLVSTGAVAEEETRQPPASSRPRIGLVLAGGGARGGAHIGALQVMEELKIPVDCIAGTSMGAIVGGLYSAGMSPQQMQEVLEKVNWGQLLSSKPERKDIAFRRKEDDDLSLFPIELGIGRKGISQKAGILWGDKVDFLLRSLTLNTTGVSDFDDLHIPFRAVAADLATGEAVVLDHGSLPQAMRASMSLPGVFTPVTLEGRVLIDGGIAMNLPVDVAFQMCADRVIAIDVGTPPKSDVSTLGTFGVMSQMVSVMSEKNVQEQRSHIPADSLLITPDLGEVGTGDFALMKEAIASGVAAARQHEAELRAFTVPDPEFEAFLDRQRRGGGRLVPETTVDAVRVQVRERDGSVVPSRLASKIRTETGKPLDTKVLFKDLTQISQSGEYEGVTYQIVEHEGRNELVIEAREKAWGPGYIAVGFTAESNFEGDSAFGAVIDYRRPKLNRFNAELKTLIFAGDQSAVSAEFYQPLGYSGFWFVAPYAGISWDSGAAVLDDEDLELVKTRRRFTGLDLGIQLSNYGELRVGAVRGDVRVDPTTETTFDPFESSVGAARLKATVDQLDNVYFPTHGNRSQLDLYFSREGLGADDEYEKGAFRTVHAWTLWRGTVLGGLELGNDFGSDLPIYDKFRLGGFLRLSGLPRDRLQGDVKGLATLVNYWRLGSLASFARRYVGVSLEAGNVWDDLSDASWGDLKYGGSLFFGLDTKFVPIYIGGGLAEGGEKSVFFFIGRPF